MTGATGFLGSVVLVEILTTWHECTVACLVRCEDEKGSGGGTAAKKLAAMGKLRIKRVLEKALLWEPGFEARIEAVVGCLEKPCFGLADSCIQALADRRPLVVHCAARVDWVRPYTALRRANVCGTWEVLNFCLNFTKPRHPLPLIHVSTGAVASLSGSDLSPTKGQGPTATTTSAKRRSNKLCVNELKEASGYVATKAVAEVLVEEARLTRGLPCAVLRPGAVTAHSKTGYANTEDFVTRYLSACAQLRVSVDAPALCELIPVDFVAAATVAVVRMLMANSQQPQSSRSVFAIANPCSPTFSALSKLLKLRNHHHCDSASSDDSRLLPVVLRACPPQEFVQSVRGAEACRLQPLLPIVECESFWFEDGGEIDLCDELWELLAIHAPLLAMPEIDEAYLFQALDWLESSQL